jgi:RNA polymerase sigma factor (sigma-70 family)
MKVVSENFIEQEIIIAIKDGNLQPALSKIYKNCFNEIVSDICYSGGTKEDGEDIFQEALLILVKKIQSGEFKEQSKIKTYLKGIARNLWMAEKRARSRRKKREDNYNHAFENEESINLWRKSQMEFAQVLSLVGESCKNILLKFYFEENNADKIHLEFGFKNIQIFRNKKYLCIKKLRDMLMERQGLIESLLSDKYHE